MSVPSRERIIASKRQMATVLAKEIDLNHREHIPQADRVLKHHGMQLRTGPPSWKFISAELIPLARKIKEQWEEKEKAQVDRDRRSLCKKLKVESWEEARELPMETLRHTRVRPKGQQEQINALISQKQDKAAALEYRKAENKRKKKVNVTGRPKPFSSAP